MIITVQLLLDKKKNAPLYTITQDKSFQDAVELMAEKKISALLVMRDDEMVGIISERDYIRKAAPKRIAPWDVLVAELMTTDVITVTPSEVIPSCMKIMSANRIRHLPVLDNNKLLGMISITDVVTALRTAKFTF